MLLGQMPPPLFLWWPIRREWGEILLMLGIQMDNPPTWTAVTLQPNTDTIWMEPGTNHSGRWADSAPSWFGWCLLMGLGHQPFALTVELFEKD